MIPGAARRAGPSDVSSTIKNEVAVALIEQTITDQVRQTAVSGGSACSYNLALLAQLRKLKLPFNNRVGPSENVYRGLPCPRLLAQYFEPVPGYGLAVYDYRVVPGHHSCFITVQLHLRDLLIKAGGAGIKELLVVLLDFCFSAHHFESGQQLDKNRIRGKLGCDASGIFLIVKLDALRDEGCSRRLKVLRTVLLGSGGQSCPDCYGYNGKQELPCRGHAHCLQEINHKEVTNIGRTSKNEKHSVAGILRYSELPIRVFSTIS